MRSASSLALRSAASKGSSPSASAAATGTATTFLAPSLPFLAPPAPPVSRFALRAPPVLRIADDVVTVRAAAAGAAVGPAAGLPLPSAGGVASGDFGLAPPPLDAAARNGEAVRPGVPVREGGLDGR